MHWNTVSYVDIRQLQVPEQLFAYADAYRSAAAALCKQMMSDATPCTWPNAAVVLMLTAHAVELFLKGAILKRSPSTDVWTRGHNIDDLSADYRVQLPEPLFKWDIPFTSGLTEAEWKAQMKAVHPSLTEAEIERLKAATPAPSIRYRYPAEKGGQEWRVIEGFEPHSFLPLLDQVANDFKRIKSQLA